MMTSYRNRGRIRCAPLSLWPHGLLLTPPATLEALACVYDNFPSVPNGILVRVKATDRLALWLGGSIRSVDQRKAAAALEFMRNSEKDRDARP